MCGIAAILLCPQARPEDEWQALRELFTRNLLMNEERGRAATGIAVVQADGRSSVHKMPLPASAFVKTDGYREALDGVDSNTVLVLGHTRLPTKGTPANNANNHPLRVGPVLGVHNGHIENDDELFLRLGYPRSGQVDSEILFHLVAASTPGPEPGTYLDSVAARLQWLNGDFTFLASDRRAPGQLLVYKLDNPLWTHYHAPWKALIFSSRYIFMRKAFGRPIDAEVLPHHALLLFDAQQLGSQPQPLAVCPLAPGSH